MADASVKIRSGASNATKLQSRDIDSAAPADTNVLAWSASDSEWEPTAAGSGGDGDVVGPSSATDDRIATFDGTTGKLIQDSGSLISGLGDVNGPGSAVDDRIVTFDSTTGKLVQDGGKTIAEAEAAAVAAVPASGWTPGVNQVVLTTSGDNVGIGVAPTEKLQVDGAMALKSQAAAPSATAGYAKIFAKETGDSTTVLLMHNDTASFVDSGPNALSTTPSNVTLDTSSYEFGPGSASFNGSSSYIDVTANAAFKAGTNHTVEFWGYRTSDGSLYPEFHYTTTSHKAYIEVNTNSSGNGFITIAWNAGSWVTITTSHSTTFALNQWNHYALVKEGNDYRMYYNGSQIGTTQTNSTAWPSSFNNTFIIQRYLNNSGSWAYFDGQIDELRVSSVARYSGSSFTVPTAAFEAEDTEMFVLDDVGNETRISPHNAQNEWEYYSKNTKTGKTIRINMEEVVRDLGELTGKDYIKDK